MQLLDGLATEFRRRRARASTNSRPSRTAKADPLRAANDQHIRVSTTTFFEATITARLRTGRPSRYLRQEIEVLALETDHRRQLFELSREISSRR